jgi:hypothetical protein
VANRHRRPVRTRLTAKRFPRRPLHRAPRGRLPRRSADDGVRDADGEERGPPVPSGVGRELDVPALVSNAGDDEAEAGSGVEPVVHQAQLGRAVAHERGAEATAAGVEFAYGAAAHYWNLPVTMPNTTTEMVTTSRATRISQSRTPHGRRRFRLPRYFDLGLPRSPALAAAQRVERQRDKPHTDGEENSEEGAPPERWLEGPCCAAVIAVVASHSDQPGGHRPLRRLA